MTANGYTGAEVSITDVSGLAAALAAAATLPISQADVTGLVAALLAKLSTSGGTIAGNLVVQDAGGTKSYGFRSSGSNLDLEGAGADIFLSVWSGPGNTGDQRNYLRLESGAALAHAIGPWIWAASPFGGEVHRIDPDSGEARLGAKNGLTNLGFCGYKGTAGAPTTGTWTAGDLIMDSAKVWWRCTAGGTPGTWA